MAKQKKDPLEETLNKTYAFFTQELSTEEKTGFGYDEKKYTHIRVDDIIVHKQIREQIDTESEEFKNFVESIKNEGVISPVWLKKEGDKYRLVAGERRYIAAKTVGLITIPAIILQKDANPLVYQIIENLQRKDLNNYEKAMAFYEFYLETVQKKNISPEQIISHLQENDGVFFQLGLSRLGVSFSSYIRYLKILCFNKDIQKFIKEHNIPILILEKLYAYRNKEEIQDMFRLYVEKGENALDSYISKLKSSSNKSSSKEGRIRYFSKIVNMRKTLEKLYDNEVELKDKRKVKEELENLKILIDKLLKDII